MLRACHGRGVLRKGIYSVPAMGAEFYGKECAPCLSWARGFTERNILRACHGRGVFREVVTIMTQGALVLEGGSLRCMFTAGVLDVFMENGIDLSYVIGVSAGTMSGMNYVSGQIGRTRKVNMDYVHDKRYISLRGLFKNREIFNFDFLFGELSKELVPFDFDGFFSSEKRFTAVATRCKTGKPEYFEKGKCPDIISAVQASSSMPILSRMIDVCGKKYLDGGLSMPIAYQKAIDEGYEKVVVVLTRDAEYRKKEPGKWVNHVYDRYFAPLPKLRESIREIPSRYNHMKEEMARLEQEGRIFVIQPEKPVTVSRVERDKRKLEALYIEGRETAQKRLAQLRAYLGIEEPLNKGENGS